MRTRRRSKRSCLPSRLAVEAPCLPLRLRSQDRLALFACGLSLLDADREHPVPAQRSKPVLVRRRRTCLTLNRAGLWIRYLRDAIDPRVPLSTPDHAQYILDSQLMCSETGFWSPTCTM